MPTLTDSQIAGAVRSAGWPAAQQTTAVAVILAESGGRSDVRNSIGASGLMQILQSAHQDLFAKYDWRDPVQNCEMGLIVYNNAAQSWRPWTTYTGGSYRMFLRRAVTATGSPAAPPNNGVVGSPSGVEAAGFTLTSGDTWKRIGYFAAGAILMLMGGMFLMRLDKFIPAGKVVKAVRAVSK